MYFRKTRSTRAQKRAGVKTSWITGVALVGLATPAYAFYLFFNELTLGDPMDWATFATFYSGLATPIIAFCSVMIFFESLRLQKTELEKTREELRLANELQVSVERDRQKLKSQEQLERIIPIVLRSHNSLYVNLKRFKDSEQEGVGSPPVESFLEWYCEKAIYLITLIEGYLDAGGNIYLTLDWMNALDSKFEVVEEYAAIHNLLKGKKYIEYYEKINALVERREEEVDNYTESWKLWEIEGAQFHRP